MRRQFLRRYNVCSGHPVSILEVATEVAPRCEREPRPRSPVADRPGDARHIVASPEQARADLGFTAATTPKVGLRAFATDPVAGAHQDV